MPARLSDDVIMGLLEMEAESQELDRSEVGITDELEAAIDAYEAALETALEEVVERWPPADGATIEDLEDVGKAAYLVLMTLRGEGVGIWDGDWDEFYSREEIDEIEEYLKRKLGKFADDSGSGSLNTALMNAAWETAGGEEDEEEEDDGDTDVPDEGYLGNSKRQYRSNTDPTKPHGRHLAWLLDPENSSRKIFVTEEPDGLFYVWHQDGLGAKPDWTYAYSTEKKAKSAMEHQAGYSRRRDSEGRLVPRRRSSR